MHTAKELRAADHESVFQQCLEFAKRRLELLSLIRRFFDHQRGMRDAFCEVMIKEGVAILFAGNHYSKRVWFRYRDLTVGNGASIVLPHWMPWSGRADDPGNGQRVHHYFTVNV